MRTTLTLDPDVVAKLRAELRRSGTSFKELVNNFLRLGLNSQRELKSEKLTFAVTPRDLGLRPGLNYDNIGELLEHLDGPLSK